MSTEEAFPLLRPCTEYFDPFDSFPPLESPEGTDQIIKYGEAVPNTLASFNPHS